MSGCQSGGHFMEKRIGVISLVVSATLDGRRKEIGWMGSSFFLPEPADPQCLHTHLRGDRLNTRAPL